MKITPEVKTDSQALAMKAEYEAKREAEKKQMKEVSKSFESLLVNQLVGQMRKTVQRSEFMPQSHAEKVYQSMLDQEYSQKIAESEELGISKLIYDHLLAKSTGQ